MAATRLEGLDTLRGFAALAVVFAHVFFFGGLPGPDVAIYAACATIAVELFFVLSAFSLCVGYFGQLQTSDDVERFYKRRILRLVPLFYLMLAVWIWLAGGIDSPAVLAANLTFTFGLLPGIHESMVPAGWSIGTEMIFYALFPAMLMVIRSWKSALAALLAGTLFAALMSDWLSVTIADGGGPTKFSRATILTCLPFFIAGIGIYFVFVNLRARAEQTRRRLSLLLWVSAAAYYALLASNADKLPQYEQFFFRYLIAGGFVTIVLATALYSPRWFVNRAFVWLGVISYGVYLIHPVMLLLTRHFRISTFSAEQVGSIWTSFAQSIATVLIPTMVAASLSYLVLERPFQRLGRRRTAPALNMPTVSAPAE